MKLPLSLLFALLTLLSIAKAAVSSSEAGAIEQRLLLSPARGEDFDSLFAFYSESENLGKLAERWKAKAESGAPDSAACWLLLSFLAEGEGRAQDAVECAQHATALSPGDPRATAALADAFLSARRPKDAITALQKALAAESKPQARAALLRQLAAAQSRASDDDGALSTWRQLIQEFPTDLAGLEEAGTAMTYAERYADAQTFFETLRDAQTATNYEKLTAVFKLGQLAEIQFDEDAARAFYRSAFSFSGPGPRGYAGWPESEAHDRIEDSFRRAGDLSGLAADYEAWLGSHPDDSYAQRRLGNVLSELGREPEAIPWLRKAAAAAPEGRDRDLSLARRLFETGQSQEAMAALHSLATAPELPHTGMEPGVKLTEAEQVTDYLTAIARETSSETARGAILEEMRRIAPSIHDSLRSAGIAARFFREQGFPADALPLYEAATNLVPENTQHFYRESWADCLFDLKRDAEARKIMHGMVEGPRASVANFLQLARAWRRRNENADALQTVQAGLDLDPDNFELLSLEWTLYAAANRWDDAAGLAPRLLETAPDLASATQVEDNDAQALRKIGRLQDTLHTATLRLSSGAQVSEIEVRRFVALALRDENPNLAHLALDAAARLFPNSPELIHDRAEFEWREGHIAEANAALQRLAELQPAQKAAWLRVIARHNLDEHFFEEAATAAQGAIEADPANRESYLLAADVQVAAGRVDAAAAILHKAILFLKYPQALRVKLARTLLDAERFDEAAAAYEITFDKYPDNYISERLALVPDMANAFARAGRLDELVARFRIGLRGAKGPWPNMLRDAWPYALYLSEIRRKQGDLSGARAEVANAFGPRSQHPEFLEQRVQIAKDQQDAPERARLARLYESAHAGRERNDADHLQIPLLLALAGNGDSEEAMRVLKDRQFMLFADPMLLHDALGKIAAAGAGRQVADFLQSSLARHADDWRIRFLLAEARLHNGETDAADKLLSEIESQPLEAAAAPDAGPDSAKPRSLPWFYDRVAYYSGYSGPAGTEFARRFGRGYTARQDLKRIAAGLESPDSSGNSSFRSGNLDLFLGNGSVPETLAEASDMALVIRSVLAQKQGRGPAFLAALQENIKVQPRSERLAILTLVQALEPLMKEIADEAAHPSGDEILNADCLEVLMTLAYQPAPIAGGVDADPAQLISLLQAFLRRERRNGALFGGARLLSQALARAGRAEEANQVAGDILDYWFLAPRDHDLDLLDFATESGAMDTARDIISRIAFDSRKRTSAIIDESLVGVLQLNFARALLAKNHADDRAVYFLNSALRISYDGNFPPLANAQSLRMRSVWNRSRVFLDGNAYIPSSYQIQTWSEIFQVAKEGGLLAYFVRSRQTPPGLPPAQIPRAKLARICFLWWNHEKDDAIREIVSLADSEKSDALHIMAASMLADQSRNDEAEKALAQASATSGATGIAKLVLELELARAANDAEKAKPIAVQLAGLPLLPNNQTHLAEILNQLGLPEKAAELNARNGARQQSFPGSEANRLAQELQAEIRAKHEPEAIALARLILSRPPTARHSIEDSARQTAIASLKRLKALPAYIAELERDLSKSPNSEPTLLLLAEASGREQPEEAIDYYRRLVQLEPGNDDYQSRLASALSQSGQREEAMRAWEIILARRPEAILGNHFFTVFTTYQSAKALGRLGDALLRAQTRLNPLADLSLSPRDLSDPIIQVAADLRRTGDVEGAIRLWRALLESKRLQSLAWFREAETVKALASALLEQGRKDDAARELESYFFPPARPKSALGFDLSGGGKEWMSPSFANGGLSSFQGMPLIRLAAQAGALDRLRAKAAATAANRPQDPIKFLVLLIDVLQRDPAKLAGLKTEFDETIAAFLKSRNPMAANALFLLGRTLSEWPEARPLALSIEEKSSDPFEYQDAGKSLQRAELAAQLGELKTARFALREWTDGADRAASNFDHSNPAQDLLAADLMSRVGMAAEARDRLRKLGTALDVRNSPEMTRQANELSNRLALLAGESSHAQITVWAAPRLDGAQKTTLYWEIGAAPGDFTEPAKQAGPAAPVRPGHPVRLASPAEPPTAITGEDLPELDGRFSIEIFHGPTPSALELLTTIPAAKMRGSWESPQPLPQGYVVAILREKGAVLFTRKSFLPAGVNLLINPNLDSPVAPKPSDAATVPEIPGWPGLNPGDIEQSPDSPNVGGHSMRLGLLRETEHSAISLQRVPLEPGKDYYFTSWLRGEGTGTRAGLGGQFLDKDGKPIGQAPPKFTTVPQRWVSCSIRLNGAVADSAHRARSMEQIPSKAAFFEPQILTGGSECQMSGLYFGEILPDANPAK